MSSDFIGDRECISHHGCECLQRKAAAYDQLLRAIEEHHERKLCGVQPTVRDTKLYETAERVERS